MSELSPSRRQQKKDWTLTPHALDLLLNWLDENAESDGQRYLEMRRRLVAYFDRKGCASPDELADETLNRVARRLEEESDIESGTPARYCYITARFVFMEYLREKQKQTFVSDEMQRRSAPRHQPAASMNDDQGGKEGLLDCLGQCMEKLPSKNREMILRYYSGKERVKIENRRALADELGVTMNALSIRACRVRDKLEICVKECASGK